LIYAGISVYLRDVASRFHETDLVRRISSALSVTVWTAWIAAALMLPEAFFGQQVIFAILSKIALLTFSGVIIGGYLFLLWQYRRFLTREIDQLAAE
jgi:hypothetical protein